ncbi:hypothetical protein Cme02nite_08240 [Catellatospora methionotrophica]|uniref:Uncharacterized protein n=1 Tax=Catellatospora methionotrophica TaxID=121620 RepID=A0A8J3L0U1_9ACTN|nr:hypothetical protein [Catellatospora methionotrophica]GIG12492.1 hypothetical protein Cme02nite_08240 [Catellatospora methionotrophica]
MADAAPPGDGSSNKVAWTIAGTAVLLLVGFLADSAGLTAFFTGKQGPQLFGSSPSASAPPAQPSVAPSPPPGSTPVRPAATPSRDRPRISPKGPPNAALSVSVNPVRFANRGVKHDVTVTVQGASRGEFIDIDLFYPDDVPFSGGVCSRIRDSDRCSVYVSSGTTANNLGVATLDTEWFPAVAYRSAATDVVGTYLVYAKDRVTGKVAHTTFTIYNDADTPPVEEWDLPPQ